MLLSIHPFNALLIYLFIHSLLHSSIHPSIHFLSIHYPSIHPSFIHFLSLHALIHSIYSFIYSIIHPSIHFSTHPSIHTFIHQFTHTPIHPSIIPPLIQLSIHSSIHSYNTHFSGPHSACYWEGRPVWGADIVPLVQIVTPPGCSSSATKILLWVGIWEVLKSLYAFRVGPTWALRKLIHMVPSS